MSVDDSLMDVNSGLAPPRSRSEPIPSMQDAQTSTESFKAVKVSSFFIAPSSQRILGANPAPDIDFFVVQKERQQKRKMLQKELTSTTITALLTFVFYGPRTLLQNSIEKRSLCLRIECSNAIGCDTCSSKATHFSCEWNHSNIQTPLTQTLCWILNSHH